VSSLMASVERLVAERRETEAVALWNQAAAIMPEHPRVLHERARRLALGADPSGARAILEGVVAASSRNIPFLLSLVAVVRALGERDEELRVLESVLAVEARHLIVLLQKGALLELIGKPCAPAATGSYGLRFRRVAASKSRGFAEAKRSIEKDACSLEPRARGREPGLVVLPLLQR
jgi:hypothetical protein